MEGLNHTVEGGNDIHLPAAVAFKLQTDQCNVEMKLQSAECNVVMDLQAGSATEMRAIEEGVRISPSEQSNCAESFAPIALHNCPHHELHREASMSYASASESNGDVPAAHMHSAEHNCNTASAAEDKKLQYTLRSNPKRSRRFLDPDYALELASPLAPSPGGPISSGLPTGPAANALPAPATGSAPPAPIKKANSLFAEKARACTECGKQFPSWKALFGHMRCHPERQWRGIQPPTSLAAAKDRPPITENMAATLTQAQQIIQDPGEGGATSTKLLFPLPSFWDQSDSENTIQARVAHPRASDYDMEESDTESIEAAYMNGREQHHRLKAQNARGRRSKRALHNVGSGGGHFSESSTPPDEVMDERDMANCLVMLAFAAKSKADESSDGDSGLVEWKNHVRQSPPLEFAETRKIETKEKRRYNGHAQKGIHFLQEGESVPEKWEEDQEKGSWERKSKFECSTCKKTFRSHQALGGHRASHKKVKGCFARTNATEEAGMPDATAEMTATALTMATTVEDPQQQQQQEEQQKVVDAGAKPGTGDQEERGAAAPALEEMSMGQFLQFSITCNEKMEEDQLHDSAIAPQKPQVKHQTSSCSSSSSIIAATAAAGTLFMHHHHPLQQPQQPKIHQCTICNRVFSTGQALGGHKRCHWGGSGMPETGKKCPLMRQDSDGGACMGISTSERSSELSRKGRQDSGSFASAEVWVNASSVVTEKDIAHSVSGLGRKGRQDSVAAQNWLGGYVSSEKDQPDFNKMAMGGISCEENNEGVSAQRGWIEAFSTTPKPSSKKLQHVGEGGYKGAGGTTATATATAVMPEVGTGEAGKWLGGRCVAETVNEGCGCSSYEDGEGGMDVQWQEQKGKGVPATVKVEELLDLNLPAPVEEGEEEEKQHGGGTGDALPPAPSTFPHPSKQWLSGKERVAESAGS